MNYPAKQNQSKAVTTTKKYDIDIAENGKVKFTSIDQQLSYASMLIQSNVLPTRYTKPEQVVVAMQFAAEMGLQQGVTSLRQIAVIKGTPSIYGDLPLAIVRASGKLKMYREFILDKQGKKICMENGNLLAQPYMAVVQAQRVGEDHIEEKFFTADQARTAGLINNETYRKYLSDMLTYRARSRLLKVQFSDVLHGIAIAEYDFGEAPQYDFETTGSSRTSAATSHLLEDEKTEEPKEPILLLEEEEKNDKQEPAKETEEEIIVVTEGSSTPLNADAELPEIGEVAVDEIGDYVIPIGRRKGHKLGEFSKDDAIELLKGVREYNEKHANSDEIGLEVQHKVIEYLNTFDGDK